MIPTLALTFALLGQADLPGSGLSIAQAKEEASYIVVAEVVKLDSTFGKEFNYVMWIGLKPTSFLKGKLDEGTLNRLPLGCRAEKPERLPKVGEELIFFVGKNYFTSKILPKTADNLAAIESAQPVHHFDTRWAGGISPVHYLGPTPGNEPREWKPATPRPFEGTKFYPSRDPKDPKHERLLFEDEMLVVERAFTDALSRNGPQPEGRRAHFDWLEANEVYRRYYGQRIGWIGTVVSIEERPEGGWIVKVNMRPLVFACYLRFTDVGDSVQETYEFVDGHARLIGSDAATARPGFQHFPSGAF